MEMSKLFKPVHKEMRVRWWGSDLGLEGSCNVWEMCVDDVQRQQGLNLRFAGRLLGFGGVPIRALVLRDELCDLPVTTEARCLVIQQIESVPSVQGDVYKVRKASKLTEEEVAA